MRRRSACPSFVAVARTRLGTYTICNAYRHASGGLYCGQRYSAKNATTLPAMLAKSGPFHCPPRKVKNVNSISPEGRVRV